MRFQFKTSYNQDIRIFRDKVDAFWYGLLAVLVLILPLLMDDYYVGETAWVFIYGICGVSLMVLVGYTGLVSLGHAAFLGIGAYAHAYFISTACRGSWRCRWPWCITTACGLIVGLPALRMTGIYLAIATLAFSVIIQEVFSRWESVTHGFAGMKVDKPVIFGVEFADRPIVLLPLPVLPGDRAVADAQPAARADRPRLDRHPRQRDRGAVDGRQPRDLQVDGLRLLGRRDGPRRRAVRAQDRLPGARHLQHPAVDPVPAAGDRGRAGLAARRGVRRDLRGAAAAADRHPARFDPRQHGQLAASTGLTPIGMLGTAIGGFLAKPGVEAGIFGLILVLVILLEPLGMYGRWLKIKLFFSTFPMYKASTFKRQKSYMRSERLR